MNIAMNKIGIWRVRYHYLHDRITIVSLLWRHQKSIVMLSAERRPSEWDTGSMCKDRRFLSSFMDSWCRVRNKIIYVLSWRTVSVLIQVLFAIREITAKNISWALKQFVTRMHALFFIYIPTEIKHTTVYHWLSSTLWKLNCYFV